MQSRPEPVHIHFVEDFFNMVMFYKIKVSFGMGTFSDSCDKLSGIFIFESPPPPGPADNADYSSTD